MGAPWEARKYSPRSWSRGARGQGSISEGLRSSADERTDRVPYLRGVAKEPVATPFDAGELRAGDALCRPDGEPVRRERRVVPGVDDQRRNGYLLEGEPVRGDVRDEPVEDGTVAPGFEGEEKVGHRLRFP